MIRFLIALFLLGGFGPGVPAAELGLDEVIERHVEAKGGRARWEEVQTLKVTGKFTAFSEIRPFTLYRKKPDLYHFDHHQGDRRVVIQFDGREGWWSNPWYGIDWPIKMTLLDGQVALQDSEFATPFFDHEDGGDILEFGGITDLDGESVYQIKIRRPEGFAELWYLDAGTFLEMARYSPGVDFGRPVEQITFFSDFRSVDGLMIPHLVETEFHTRHRVMEIEQIEVDVPVGEEFFIRPVPRGMGTLAFLEGHWTVEWEERSRPDEEMKPLTATAVITSLLDGAVLHEVLIPEGSNGIVRQYSYDRFKELYRITQLDELTTHLSVFEGKPGKEGLVVTNLETNTAAKMFERVLHERMTILEVGPNEFGFVREKSADGGKNWFADLHLKYRRSTKGTSPASE